jgi:hypothetical protein
LIVREQFSKAPREIMPPICLPVTVKRPSQDDNFVYSNFIVNKNPFNKHVLSSGEDNKLPYCLFLYFKNI